MLTNELIDLFDETPGILLSGEAAESLADDVQALVIKHMLASPNKAALRRYDDQELKNAIEDVYVSTFGVQLHNALAIGPDFPGKEHVTPEARKDIVVAMIRAMILEQARHIVLTSEDSIDVFLLREGLESINTIRQRRIDRRNATFQKQYGRGVVEVAQESVTTLEKGIRAFEDFQQHGC